MKPTLASKKELSKTLGLNLKSYLDFNNYDPTDISNMLFEKGTKQYTSYYNIIRSIVNDEEYSPSTYSLYLLSKAVKINITDLFSDSYYPGRTLSIAAEPNGTYNNEWLKEKVALLERIDLMRNQLETKNEEIRALEKTILKLKKDSPNGK